MRKKILGAYATAALLTSISSFQPAYAIEYKHIDLKNSHITFISKQMGVPVEGQFRTVTVNMNFDPQKVINAKAAISIEMKSIDAGSKEANDEVMGSAWFDIKNFPQASFKSTSIKSLGNQNYQVSGQLTLKGKTLPVSAPFTFKTQGQQGQFQGSFTIKRTDYGIGSGVWGDESVVAKDVHIQFSITARAE